LNNAGSRRGGVHHLTAAGDVALGIQMLIEPVEQLLDQSGLR
jgi:hypothetical protein